MMKYSYFPGCSAATTGKSFTLSTDYVAEKIGFEMIEIPDWNCCGTSAAALTSPELEVALPARSLAISEEVNPGLDIVAPCAGCYRSLKRSVTYARASQENLEKVQQLIDRPYQAQADVVSLLEAFAADDVKAAISEKIVRKLRTLKVASYYGCAMVRPADMCQFDDTDDPQSMDGLMALIGAEPVEWAFKTECCGAAQQMAVPKQAKSMIERIFQNAEANGADCIATACPLCQLNLDMRQKEINEARVARGEKPFDIPCYYFTELIGLALGGSPAELGIEIHFHPALALLEQQKKAADAADAAAAEEAARKKAEMEAKIAAKKAEKVAKEQAAAPAADPAETAAPAAEPADVVADAPIATEAAADALAYAAPDTAAESSSDGKEAAHE